MQEPYDDLDAMEGLEAEAAAQQDALHDQDLDEGGPDELSLVEDELEGLVNEYVSTGHGLMAMRTPAGLVVQLDEEDEGPSGLLPEVPKPNVLLDCDKHSDTSTDPAPAHGDLIARYGTGENGVWKSKPVGSVGSVFVSALVDDLVQPTWLPPSDAMALFVHTPPYGPGWQVAGNEGDVWTSVAGGMQWKALPEPPGMEQHELSGHWHWAGGYPGPAWFFKDEWGNTSWRPEIGEVHCVTGLLHTVSGVGWLYSDGYNLRYEPSLPQQLVGDGTWIDIFNNVITHLGNNLSAYGCTVTKDGARVTVTPYTYNFAKQHFSEAEAGNQYSFYALPEPLVYGFCFTNGQDVFWREPEKGVPCSSGPGDLVFCNPGDAAKVIPIWLGPSGRMSGLNVEKGILCSHDPDDLAFSNPGEEPKMFPIWLSGEGRMESGQLVVGLGTPDEPYKRYPQVDSRLRVYEGKLQQQIRVREVRLIYGVEQYDNWVDVETPGDGWGYWIGNQWQSGQWKDVDSGQCDAS